MTDARPNNLSPLERLEQRVAQGLRTLPMAQVSGAVVEVSMSHYRVAGLSRFLKLGECVGVDVGNRVEIGEVVRIDDSSATLKPFATRSDVTIGARAFRTETLALSPHRAWKGRVIDALGRPIDGAGELPHGDRPAPLDAPPPPALRRARVHASLLAMLARATPIDTIVIALVGERGREVREFLQDTLGENRSSAVAVVSTGDESPMMRRLAPKTAMAIAEYFRDMGESVLLIVDSVTRFAHAARDVALAAGEPAVARGYAPSVFSDLPRLLERAGPGVEGSGSITGIFSVLVDGDDHNDPVADAIRGALDGHIVLDRAIADDGRYPAVNILSSVSRMTNPMWRPEQRKVVGNLRSMIARFEETRELRLMGGYTAGADPVLDKAIKSAPRIYEAMSQTVDAPRCDDPFIDLAAALRNESKIEA